MFWKKKSLLGKIILFFGLALFISSTVYAGDLSNKWRIKINHNAKSDGEIVFRLSPENQTAIDVTVHIKAHTMENSVAADIKKAMKAQLPKDGFHVERDDFEDVLIKKRGDTPDFGLELVSSSVEGVSIDIHKE
jgi:hypothetical protein